MPIQLTMCRLCTRSRPDFLRTVAKLVKEHPDDLFVVELDCMAACDDVPAIMVEYDYHPQVTPQELTAAVHTALSTSMPGCNC
jgi:NADH:ubiquinone oxidoreductase subunit E